MSLYAHPTLAQPRYEIVPHQRRYSAGGAAIFTAKELAYSMTEFGLLGVSVDPLLGPGLLWCLPNVVPTDAEFQAVLALIADFEEPAAQAKIIAYLAQNPAAPWYLIPAVLEAWRVKNDRDKLPHVLKFLAKHGAEYTFIFFSPSAQGAEPLSVADLDTLLLAFGLNAVSNLHFNPFYVCLTANHSAEQMRTFVNRLLRAGCDPNQSDVLRFKHTLLHELIARQGSHDPLNVFIEVTAAYKRDCVNYTSTDCYGNTPLALASGLGNLPMVSKLLAVGQETKQDVGINTPDHLGRRPIHLAAALGYVEICQALCQAGADLTLTDNARQDLTFYMNAPADTILEIFKQMSIHPERSCYADGNYVCLNTPDLLASCCFTDATRLRPPEVILLSPRKPHIDRLQHAILTVGTEHPEWLQTLNQQYQILTPEGGEHYQKTVFEISLINQAKTRAYLQGLLTSPQTVGKTEPASLTFS